jgi:hypothetical protein
MLYPYLASVFEFVAFGFIQTLEVGPALHQLDTNGDGFPVPTYSGLPDGKP